MPKLYLLRHAHAESDFSLDDKNRSLSARGIKQAQSLVPYINDIQKTLCSSAIRTQITAQTIKGNSNNLGTIEYQDYLYNASAGDILNAIQSCQSENLLVIAHNPGIHLLARSLANKGDKTKMEKLDIFYNPATLSIFNCDIESWSDIKPQSNELIDLIIPD